jgi:hypothetical protein
MVINMYIYIYPTGINTGSIEGKVGSIHGTPMLVDPLVI